MPDSLPKTRLSNGTEVRRVAVGLWQMADQERDGHAYNHDTAAEHLADYARSGFDTFDMADHYGSAEIVAGKAARILEADGRTAPVIMTKWCPPPGPMDQGTVRQGVETALERLGRDHVDVMHFHWWRYESPQYMDALTHLQDLRDEGLIGGVGLTNFDTQHLRMISKHGIDIVSNQVCFSLLDRRAAGRLAEVAQETGTRIFGFGTLCGGFLSDSWLDTDEPQDLPDWSRMKYKRFVDIVGGWKRFQSLLRVLSDIALKHGVTVSNVATRWILAQRAVASVIIGVRLGENDHRADNLRLMSFDLDETDLAAIAKVTRTLNPVPGDCGDEYRKPPFLTASGDLSHHLDELPPVHTVRTVGRRQTADSGSIWEKRAGFARAVRDGNRILVSGTTATDPLGDPIAVGDAEAQAVFILDKISAAISSLGGSLDDVIRTRIYLQDASHWEAVSQVHQRYFGDIMPANTLISASLIGPYLVEIEAEAQVAANDQ
ncbi:MAG: aldo/keto reductase [Hyphomicrobiales bacterium]|nr:aldo/keto reductase [Hyphomicrobiales bacterium]